MSFVPKLSTTVVQPKHELGIREGNENAGLGRHPLGTKTPVLLPFPSFLFFVSFGANANARDTKLELKEEKNLQVFCLICHVFFVVVAPWAPTTPSLTNLTYGLVW